MKITNKQKEEINFLSRIFNIQPTEKEIEEYINISVYGKGSGKVEHNTQNKLLIASRKLVINIEMWREDLTRGLLNTEELREDFHCDYGDKIINSILKSVNKEYRQGVFSKNKEFTILGLTNFPEIIALLH